MQAKGAPADLAAGQFYVLDVFRGLAAVAVLVWHYQNFYFFSFGLADRSTQPLYEALQLFYDHGDQAVPFFWMLSGFVLAATYQRKRIGAWAFGINRFARLYPLHLVTLLFAALVSFLAFLILGRPVYPNDDLPHFLTHLFFASGWQVLPFSFNAPIWSVSVEIVIYAVFWVLLPILMRWGPLVPLSVVALSAAWFHSAATNPFVSAYYFSSCAMFFFAGVTVFWVQQSPAIPPLLGLGIGLAGAVGGAWLLMNVQPMQYGLVTTFAGLLVLIAMSEKTFIRPWAARMRWLGDGTYSMYLWHMPLILLTAIVLVASNIGTEIVASPFFFLTFIAVMLVIGRVSYVAFERPMRQAIRVYAGNEA